MFMRRRSSTELVVTTQCLPRAAVIGVCLASCVVCVARPPRAICPRHRPRPLEWAAAVTTSHNPVSVSRVSPPVRAGSRAWVVGRWAPCSASAHAALQVACRRDGKSRWPRRPGLPAAHQRLSFLFAWRARRAPSAQDTGRGPRSGPRQSLLAITQSQ